MDELFARSAAPRRSRELAARCSTACSTCCRAATRRTNSPSCGRGVTWDRVNGTSDHARGRQARGHRERRHDSRSRPVRRVPRRRADGHGARRRARRGDGLRGACRRNVPARRIDAGASSRSRTIACSSRPLRASPARCRSGRATGRAGRSSWAWRSASWCASCAALPRRPPSSGCRHDTGSTPSPPRTCCSISTTRQPRPAPCPTIARSLDRALPRRARRLAHLRAVAARQPRARAVGDGGRPRASARRRASMSR